MKLCFGIIYLEVIGYTDTDFARDVDYRKSTSGHVFLIGGTIVSWLSKKQGCVAKHIMKVEYTSCNTTESEAVWIKQFVDCVKLGILNRPVDVFYDNKFTISLIKSGTNSSKGKHIKKIITIFKI